VLALDVVFVERDAVHRAHLLTLGFVVVADAFGAQVGVDDVDLLALGDGAVGAFGFADVAVDAVVGDFQGHATAPVTAPSRDYVTSLRRIVPDWRAVR